MKIYEKVSQILIYAQELIKPGAVMRDVDQLVAKRMAEMDVVSSDFQYKPDWANVPFPAHICLSVNDVICHGIPNPYAFKEGDIVTIDIGIKDKKTGECGDAAITVGVGEIANKDERLLRYAKRAVYVGIQQIHAGAKVIDIGRAISVYSLQMGYVVNKAFSGHAIGPEMHMEPYIPNHWEITEDYEKQFDGVLKEGDIVCIEPMLTYGKDPIGMRLNDGWTWQTRDHKNVAMFEHMVRVEKDGATILTTHFDETFMDNPL